MLSTFQGLYAAYSLASVFSHVSGDELALKKTSSSKVAQNNIFIPSCGSLMQESYWHRLSCTYTILLQLEFLLNNSLYDH